MNEEQVKKENCAIPEAEKPGENRPPEQSPQPKPQQQRQHVLLPSPISIFAAEKCRDCESKPICMGDDKEKGMALIFTCLRIVEYYGLKMELDTVRRQNKTFQKLLDQLNQPEEKPQQPQRNTHPTQGTMDDGIVWIKSLNSAGETYEKALEKDNEHSTAYQSLVTRLLQKLREGKKGLEDGGKWYFLSTQCDWIGRKPKKDFSKRT